jgi:alpha-glucosidase
MHLFDKTQPDNLVFLQRLRGVLDEFGAASVGEVGDEKPLPVMAAYTQAGQRLHMAYSFALLTPTVSAAHIREQVEGLERELALTGGWGCWALSNHDVPRVASRWAPGGVPDGRLTRTLLALLFTLKGSVSLYEGEELGLPEADIPFELLQDPYGKTFWPRFKGRDGCRTPMPWQSAAPQAGFNAGATPWLPLGQGHAERAVDLQEADAGSVLNQARALLAWRRSEPRLRLGAIAFHEALGEVLLFERRLTGGASLVLAFNLGPEDVLIPLPPALSKLAPLSGTPLAPADLDLREGTWNLPAFGAAIAVG